MIDASRDHAPDIPDISNMHEKDLFLFITPKYISVRALEKFRDEQGMTSEYGNIIAFVGSQVCRRHVLDMLAFMHSKPGVLPENAHHAWLAEQRSTQQIAHQASDTHAQIGTLTDEIAA